MPMAAATKTGRVTIVAIATPHLCFLAASKAELLAEGADSVPLDEGTAADRFADEDAAPTGCCMIICEPPSAAAARDEPAAGCRDSFSRFSRFTSARISAAP